MISSFVVTEHEFIFFKTHINLFGNEFFTMVRKNNIFTIYAFYINMNLKIGKKLKFTKNNLHDGNLM